MAVALAVCGAAFPDPGQGQVRTTGRGGVTLLPAPGSPGSPVGFVGPIAGSARATVDHPLFHSSYMGEEDQVVATTRYGPVTSRDLYLWLILRDAPAPFLLENYRKARTVSEREAVAETLRREIDDFVFTNYVLPQRMGNGPCDAVSGLREQLRILPAYQLTYLLRLIRPSVCIQQADRVKFLQEHRALYAQPERYRVRYIRLKSTFTEPIEEQDRVEARIVDLRQQIAQGDLTFAEAARRFSQAPSAARGGEIPPFAKGQLFFFFEEALSSLEPGEVSQPFRGPDGSYYLVQLLEVLPPQEPTLDDPDVAARVDEALWRKVLRAQYEYEGRLLFERNPVVLLISDWDTRADSDLVGYVGDFALTKGQMRDLFPFIEGDDLRRRDTLVFDILRPLLEREAMAQEVRQAGCDHDPILQRARWIVQNLTRRDAFMEQCEATLRLDEATVRSFWRRNPKLFTPMAMKRLFRVTLSPTNVGPPAEALVGELARILTVTARGEAPTALPPAMVASPGSIVDEVLSAGGAGAQELFGEPLPPEPFGTEGDEPLELDLSPIDTTGTLELPASQLADDLTTDGLETAELESTGTLETTGTVDLTVPQGGAAPTPAAGGGLASGLGGFGGLGAAAAAGTDAAAPPAPAPALPPPVPAQTIQPAAPPAPPAAVPAPPGAPATDAVAQEVDWSRIGPYEAVPNPLCPPIYEAPLYGNSLADFVAPRPPAVPWPSSIPFNPDLRFPKISATEFTALFKSYQSPDFALRVEDLGYLYVQDRKEIPVQVADLEPGAFSYPVPAGPAAVSYYVAGARQPVRPRFEEIRSRVYATYRQVHTQKCISDTMEEALKQARVEYRFE